MFALVLLYIRNVQKYFCSLCRAKLAEWMASKGKTFKRPAMATTAAAAAPSKTKAGVKPAADVKTQPEPQPESGVQTRTEAQSATHCQPEASLEAHELDSAAQCADNKDTEQTAPSQTPAIMNTTLDLLENSDADVSFEPQDRVDDVRRWVGFLAGFKIFLYTIIYHVLLSINRSL